MRKMISQVKDGKVKTKVKYMQQNVEPEGADCCFIQVNSIDSIRKQGFKVGQANKVKRFIAIKKA